MERALPMPGTPVLLRELLQPSSPFRTQSASLRVLGRLERYHAESGVAVIVQGDVRLGVDTQFLRNMHFREGSLYQFIGELRIEPANENLILVQARVARNVDGLDVDLYEKSLELRRRYEKKMFASS
ncbi:hypothetical protein O6H91_05G120000 [Diphasiastrum complanatum]|uniref:Uncharacterized protein n=2 Tax=Diphasiastrum complanatum TaxID=34168 RepID=A0ACC2DSM7_DIPCM|nr:hypothetical protein O6H91_17G087400 [Diphasiastrum complanatum]KAJ7557281.1 hypothetical protein O6H91_05G120000 [Diphasiastrum complanatum]